VVLLERLGQGRPTRWHVEAEAAAHEAVVLSLLGVEAPVVGHGRRVRGTTISICGLGLHAISGPWRGLGCVAATWEGSSMTSVGVVAA
jgi:hypothetical protein